MKFKVIKHVNREEWLQWRQNGVGSSDVAAIMGVSRFKDYDQLLAEKSQPVAVEDQANAYIKDRGNKIETQVRDFYAAEMGTTFDALVCQDLEKPYLLASLDGIDPGHNLIIEIKLLTSQKENSPNHETPGYLKWLAARKSELIPPEYYPQVQHQLSVTGAPACVFIGYKETKYVDRQPRPVTLEDLAIATVLPNPEYIKVMNEKIDVFWNEVIKRRENESKRNDNKDSSGSSVSTESDG